MDIEREGGSDDRWRKNLTRTCPAVEGEAGTEVILTGCTR